MSDQRSGIRVTVTDLETGERESQVIHDDYVLICDGACYLHHTNPYGNGTHVLTVKGRGAKLEKKL